MDFFYALGSLNVRTKGMTRVCFTKRFKVVLFVSHNGCLSRILGTKKSDSSMSHPGDARSLPHLLQSVEDSYKSQIEPDVRIIKHTNTYFVNTSVSMPKKLQKFQNEDSSVWKELSSEKAITPKRKKKTKKNHFLKILQTFVQKCGNGFPFRRSCK